MPQIHVQFKTDDDVLAEQLSDRHVSSGVAAKLDLQRYYWMIDEELKRLGLSEAEALELWNAFHGVNTTHLDMLEILKTSVASEVKIRSLSSKIQAMSPGCWIAVVHAIDSVGGASYHVDDLVGELKRVGLIQK